MTSIPCKPDFENPTETLVGRTEDLADARIVKFRWCLSLTASSAFSVAAPLACYAYR